MRSLFTISFIFLFFIVDGQNIVPSTFNNLLPQTDSLNNDYSFIVSGHFYGDGTNKSGYPANTLLANLDWINSSNATMLICLGDLFMDIRNDIPKYKTSLFDKLEIPLYNAVGNHDISAKVYQENFGKTYYYFLLNNDIHVVLDTEMGDGDIEGEQFEMLQEIKKLSSTKKFNNILFYAHRTIWKDSYAEMENLFKDNTQSLTSTNFKSDILPMLKEMAINANIFWFAGSLGDAPASFFYFKDESNHITYIATAIRALLRDAMLMVHVKNGVVSFETKSLTNQKLEKVEHYNLDFWNTTSAAEPFNYKLIPLYMKNAFFHRYFWYGIAFVLCLLFAIRLVWRKLKLKK